MMQKSLAVAVVTSALIIAAALVYHGRQLAEVSRRLDGMEQRTTRLDNRLDQFSRELPTLVGQAGNNAGREAVHGMVEEAVQMPLNWLKGRRVPTSANAPRRVSSVEHFEDSATGPAIPWVQLNIRQPVVTVEILPNLKEVPAIPWLPINGMNQTSSRTNDTGAGLFEPAQGAKPK